MTKRNFLLGKGERLVEEVVGIRGGGPKSHPYTFVEAKSRIAPMLTRMVRDIDQLPPEACPNDIAVAAITLNPEFIAKSYFPEKLLDFLGLEPVGSRPRRITPEKRSKGREPEEAITTELFVKGPRSAFRTWRSALPNWQEDAANVRDLPTIEEVVAPTARDKIKGRLPKKGDVVFEVVLHNGAGTGANGTLPQFREYLRGLGIDQPLDRRFAAGGLCFVELEAPAELADRIATFTPVRALRHTKTNAGPSHPPPQLSLFARAHGSSSVASHGAGGPECSRRHFRWRHSERASNHKVGETDRSAGGRQCLRRISETWRRRNVCILIWPYRSIATA